MVISNIFCASGMLIGRPALILTNSTRTCMHTLHVYSRAWKNELSGVKPEKQVEMYQTLSVLAKETSSFIQLWMPIEPDFVKYFT